jgi:hypothetical protein
MEKREFQAGAGRLFEQCAPPATLASYLARVAVSRNQSFVSEAALTGRRFPHSNS